MSVQPPRVAVEAASSLERTAAPPRQSHVFSFDNRAHCGAAPEVAGGAASGREGLEKDGIKNKAKMKVESSLEAQRQPKLKNPKTPKDDLPCTPWATSKDIRPQLRNPSS